MQWTGTTWTIIKEGHIRIIPAKFGKNPAGSLGGDDKTTGDGRSMIQDGHPTITIAHHEPMAH